MSKFKKKSKLQRVCFTHFRINHLLLMYSIFSKKKRKKLCSQLHGELIKTLNFNVQHVVCQAFQTLPCDINKHLMLPSQWEASPKYVQAAGFRLISSHTGVKHWHSGNVKLLKARRRGSERGSDLKKQGRRLSYNVVKLDTEAFWWYLVNSVIATAASF